MSATEVTYKCQETIEPLLDRIAEWPCEVESVYPSGEAEAVLTLPYIDMPLRVRVDRFGEVIADPRPSRILWFEVVGTVDDDPRPLKRVFLSRDQAVGYFGMLDDAELRTYHNAECVKVETEVDLADEINAEN